MNQSVYHAKEALSLLKAGYHLTSIIDRKEERFYALNGNVAVLSENKSLILNSYEFLEIYKDTAFEVLDDSPEETVDMKKDEEYYSWKQ